MLRMSRDSISVTFPSSVIDMAVIHSDIVRDLWEIRSHTKVFSATILLSWLGWKIRE